MKFSICLGEQNLYSTPAPSEHMLLSISCRIPLLSYAALSSPLLSNMKGLKDDPCFSYISLPSLLNIVDMGVYKKHSDNSGFFNKNP